MTIDLEKLLVNWVNIVIIAEYHNASLLNPDFLRINEIVPFGWKESENVTTPGFALVMFDNIRITLDQNRLEIKENKSDQFPVGYSPIYEIADKYINTIRHVKYTTFGLNWSINYPINETKRWIIDKFLKDEFREFSDLVDCSINLTFDSFDSNCNLRFNKVNLRNADELQEEVIQINANFDHRISKDSGIDDITKRIYKWNDKQKFLKDKLMQVLD